MVEEMRPGIVSHFWKGFVPTLSLMGEWGGRSGCGMPPLLAPLLE